MGVRFLVRVLLPVGVLCRGEAVQLHDVVLGHFALACIGAGVFVAVVGSHHRIWRWIGGQS